MDNRPIGFFDSGIGGLTSVAYVMEMLPNEQIIFFGDTARTPYGSKSEFNIERFSVEIAEFLVKHDVKMIVIACNTVTATCLDTLKKRFKDIPIIGVIKPTAKVISNICTEKSNIGIIATNVTVRSKAYERQIHKLNPKLNLFSIACPAFVPLIEEGIIENEIMDMTIKYYLDDFIIKNNITDIVLGCTHYPLIGERIKNIYPDINLISSSKEVAIAVDIELKKHNLSASSKSGDNIFFASDLSDNFINMINLITKNDRDENTICFHNFEL